METAKQLSVILANKPGRLAAMLDALNKEKVGLRALSVMDRGERGTLRFVPADYGAAVIMLDKSSIRYEATDVLLVEISPQHGSFRKVCERLAKEHLNIDYAYCSINDEAGHKGGSLAIIKVNNLTKAQHTLSESGNGRRKLPVRRPVRAR